MTEKKLYRKRTRKQAARRRRVRRWTRRAILKGKYRDPSASIPRGCEYMGWRNRPYSDFGYPRWQGYQYLVKLAGPSRTPPKLRNV